MNASEQLSRVMGMGLTLSMLKPLQDATAHVVRDFHSSGQLLGEIAMTGVELVGATYLVCSAFHQAQQYISRGKQTPPPIAYE